LIDGEEFSKQSFAHHLGEENLQKVINFSLKYISELNIPVKR
jgi:hypothetical protein